MAAHEGLEGFSKAFPHLVVGGGQQITEHNTAKSIISSHELCRVEPNNGSIRTVFAWKVVQKETLEFLLQTLVQTR